MQRSRVLSEVVVLQQRNNTDPGAAQQQLSVDLHQSVHGPNQHDINTNLYPHHHTTTAFKTSNTINFKLLHVPTAKGFGVRHPGSGNSKGSTTADRKHNKRSLYYTDTEARHGDTVGSGLLYNSNFEFVSNWSLTEEEVGGSATEMSDDQLRSLGFPVPMTTTSRSGGGGHYHGGGGGALAADRDTHIPVIDNPFIQFLSRK